MEKQPNGTDFLKLRILIVDDEPQWVEPYAAYFTWKGHETRMAASGKEALQILFKGGVDCVVIDLLMPEMTGDVLLEHVQRYPELRELSYVILTAIDEYDTENKFLRDAAMRIRGDISQFTKPAEPKELLKVFDLDTRSSIKRLHRLPGDYPPVNIS